MVSSPIRAHTYFRFSAQEELMSWYHAALLSPDRPSYRIIDSCKRFSRRLSTGIYRAVRRRPTAGKEFVALRAEEKRSTSFCRTFARASVDIPLMIIYKSRRLDHSRTIRTRALVSIFRRTQEEKPAPHPCLFGERF